MTTMDVPVEPGGGSACGSFAGRDRSPMIYDERRRVLR
ncbi:hypothetical protein Mesop_5214 [Mesorhizobium opportunistum WSM2075]|uniref:Uncharacterized protein n=1 Tax=Mesorhizobium opportunistum (strain LMG 24607 / HAMBI 3007 / WSM2075) TaxID=536019 RepID=F7Y605_MESOW|nr:hypothetical protein Mesop_5214 [Mesorhizobium opportunistum WSM2075]